MTNNVGKALIDEKYEELSRYIMSLGRRWNLDSSRVDDIVNSVVIRLLEENEKQQFEDNRKMWGRATNIAREEIAKMFSSSLPLSGVGFQAHWTATKALQKAGNDPLKAYKEQTGSSRVSRELMFLVAGGSGLRAPDILNEIIPNDETSQSSLSIQDEDNIRVALSALSDVEANVVRLKIWNRMTYPQISQELGISHESARSIYKRAISKLKPLLQASFARLM